MQKEEISRAEAIKVLASRLENFKREIELALSIGVKEYTFNDVVDEVFANKATFLDYGDAFMIVHVNDHPLCRNLNITIAGGNKETLIKRIPNVVDLAKAVNAQHVTINGRKGWLRALQGTGFEDSNVHSMHLVVETYNGQG